MNSLLSESTKPLWIAVKRTNKHPKVFLLLIKSPIQQHLDSWHKVSLVCRNMCSMFIIWSLLLVLRLFQTHPLPFSTGSWKASSITQSVAVTDWWKRASGQMHPCCQISPWPLHLVIFPKDMAKIHSMIAINLDFHTNNNYPSSRPSPSWLMPGNSPSTSIQLNRFVSSNWETHGLCNWLFHEPYNSSARLGDDNIESFVELVCIKLWNILFQTLSL